MSDFATITLNLDILSDKELRQIARSAHKRDDLHAATIIKSEIAKREQSAR